MEAINGKAAGLLGPSPPQGPVAFSERDGPAAALGRELLEYIGILFD